MNLFHHVMMVFLEYYENESLVGNEGNTGCDNNAYSPTLSF